jgi:hypothetical protein
MRTRIDPQFPRLSLFGSDGTFDEEKDEMGNQSI